MRTFGSSRCSATQSVETSTSGCAYPLPAKRESLATMTASYRHRCDLTMTLLGVSLTRASGKVSAPRSGRPIGDVLPEHWVAHPLHEWQRRPVRSAIRGKGYGSPLLEIPAREQRVVAHHDHGHHLRPHSQPV